MSENRSPAIGIDLGTTNSCVAVYRNGTSEIIPNNVGGRTTPSYVGFQNGEILFGEIAKRAAQRHFENIIYDAKRLIGRRFNDKTVQNDIKNWPFRVVNNNGKPEFKIKNNNDEEIFYCPEKISSIILEKLKEAASQYTGTTITRAVITVPAYFNNSQRQATEDAGKLAGLEVLRLLNEPTAAAIAYVLDKTEDQPKYIMIFDLGGGTFDVSIIKFEDRCVTVKAIDGDTHLGGEDFDNNLLNYLVQDIKENYNLDIKNDKRSLARLREQCENAKRFLSFQSLIEIQLDYFLNGNDYQIKITKAKFEDLNEELFQQTLTIVRNCLHQANLQPHEIEDVVLVGGSTRIPRIQDLLKNFFGGKVLSHSISPDEAVALGAAIHAASLGDHESQTVQDFVLKDVVPLTLGVETAGGLMSIFINRNTPIPAVATKCFTTARNNQSSIKVKIFEGERPLTIHNNFLGELQVTGIFPAPAGVPRIDETFTVDKNGILSVTAVERSSGKTLNLVLDLNKGRLSEDEIKKILEDAEISKTQDEKHWNIIKCRNELESYCYQTLKLVQNIKMTVSDRNHVILQCNETLAGMADSHKEDEKQLSQKLRNLKYDCESIINTYIQTPLNK